MIIDKQQNIKDLMHKKFKREKKREKDEGDKIGIRAWDMEKKA